MGPLLTPWNIGIWVSWLVGFGAREVLALVWRSCPWDTFSRFVWDIQVKWEWATLGVVFVLGVLASHLVRIASISEGDREPIREQVRQKRVQHALGVIARERIRREATV